MKRPLSRITVKVRRLPHAKGLPLPAYQTPDAAGMDLLAAIPEAVTLLLEPDHRVVIPTGLSFELPGGSEAQVRPRSGLAAKYGVTVLNSPGTIDADYRGEVSVILINLGAEPFAIRRGDRVAQMIIAPVTQAKLVDAKTLSQTSRGAGGFGSTGVAVGAKTKTKRKRKSVAPMAVKAKSAASKVLARKPR